MKEKNIVKIGELEYRVIHPCPKNQYIAAREINNIINNVKNAVGIKTAEKILNADTMDLFFTNFYGLTDSGIILKKNEIKTIVRAAFLGSIYTVIDEMFADDMYNICGDNEEPNFDIAPDEKAQPTDNPEIR